jgi:hypothetical protein
MKMIYQGLTWACCSLLCLAGVSEVKGISSPRPIELAQTVPNTVPSSSQNMPSASQKHLEVLVPELATIRLVGGGSRSGNLTDFNATDLTLSAEGFSETLALVEVAQVNFRGNVWIINPDGERRPQRIRGISVTLEGVPVDALVFRGSGGQGMLDLDGVLNDREFDRLSNNPERIHAIKQLVLESSGEMAVKIVALRR